MSGHTPRFSAAPAVPGTGSVAGSDRWRSYPVLGTVLSVAAVAVPFALSVAAAVTAGRVVPHRHGLIDQGLWWEAVLARRCSPSSAPTGCAGAFSPGRIAEDDHALPRPAPKRLKVAWRAGLTRDLERRARSDVAGDAPAPRSPPRSPRRSFPGGLA